MLASRSNDKWNLDAGIILEIGASASRSCDKWNLDAGIILEIGASASRSCYKNKTRCWNFSGNWILGVEFLNSEWI